MNLTYRNASLDDAELLIQIYNAAFYDDFIRYGMCPGYGRTPEEMRQSVMRFPKQIIEADSKPVGVISLRNNGGGRYYLGCLCVIPAYQHRGIGTQAIRHMLAVCNDWREVTLVTPADKKENVQFYLQNGFAIENTQMDEEVKVFSFRMQNQIHP